MKTANSNRSASLEFHPLTISRWKDFEKLFGKNGACGGCWCMWWRISRSEFEMQKGEGNRRAMKAIVQSGEVPGILAYQGREPVGWCSVAPRERFHSLNRSRVLRGIDKTPVWSIVCFFIAKEYRNKGMTRQLIRAAIDYVRQNSGKVIEAYPSDPRGRRLAPVSSFMGLPSVYKQAGFVEFARPSESKVIMRYRIK
jgi:GNAT superfamily N-acetyltransferase